MVQVNFNAQSVEPNAGPQEAIPKGWYNAAMVSSEMKSTRDKMGAYLELVYGILGGPHNGAKLYARLNIQNSSEKAQEIAYSELSAICHASGVLQLATTEQLHNIPIKIRVKFRVASGDYDDSNDITSYKDANAVVKMASEDISNGIDMSAGIPGMGAPTNATPPPQMQQPQQTVQQPVQQVQQPQMQPGVVQQPVQQQPMTQPQMQPGVVQQPQMQPQQPVQEIVQQPIQQPQMQQPVQEQPVMQQQVQQPGGEVSQPWKNPPIG